MADFKLGRIKFKWRGNWATSTSYLIDDVVKYGGNSYVAIKNHTSPNNENIFYTSPETYTNLWSLQGESLFFKGTYANSTWYKLNDLVKYGQRQYRCTTAHTSSSTVLDTSKFELYLEALDYKGDYATSTYYKVNDVVKYGGGQYKCTTAHTSSGSAGAFDETKFTEFTEGLQFEDSYNSSTVYQEGDIVTHGGYAYIATTEVSGVTPVASASQWDTLAPGFNSRGTWSTGNTYKTGDTVEFSGWTYACKLDTPSTGLTYYPGNTTYWDVLGEGFKYQGDWSSATTYYKGDVVNYSSSSYVAVAHNFTTTTPGTDASKWKLLAQGDSGAVMTTRGDIIVRDATQTTRLPIGVPGSYLTTDGTDVSWSNAEGANVKYVANSGSDSNVGTQALPYKTINYALSQATSGDVLEITSIAGGTGGIPGTYNVTQSSTDGSGTGFTARVVTDGSSTPTVTITSGGSGHAAGDTITVAGTQLTTDSSTVVNLTFDVVSASVGDVIYIKNGVYRENLPLKVPEGVTVQGESLRGTEVRPNTGTGSQIKTVSIVGNVSGATDGTYSIKKATTSTGSGKGAYVNITVASNVVSAVTIHNGGYGFAVGNQITLSTGVIGCGGSGTLTLQVASLENNDATDMFLLNNTTNLVQMSMKGLTGATSATIGAPAVTALDPEGSITTSSPYVQNCSSVNAGATGIRIDGNIHSAGNKSILANDFTQINSDGIGVHCLAGGRGEMVSVFTYYCAKSFYAHSGGFIRGLNCSSAYGEKGAVAEGTLSTEVPVSVISRGEMLKYATSGFVGAATESDVADTLATSGTPTAAAIVGDTSGATATIIRTNISLDFLHITGRSGNFQQGEVCTVTKDNSSTFQLTLDAGHGDSSAAQTGQQGPLIAVDSTDSTLTSATAITVGANVQFAGDSTHYRVSAVSETNTSAKTALIRLTSSVTSLNAIADNTTTTITNNFSNVRLTGHDFLDIGTGDFSTTNYPGGPSQPADQSDEVDEVTGGRVYFTSTDQQGDFRIGDLFRIEQATGVATLNADAFDLSGLNELQLGSIGAQLGATINEFSTDETLGNDSNTAVPTERAIVGYTQRDQMGTGHLVPPTGTTAERPTGDSLKTGGIRYNSSLVTWEGYNGTQWTGLGGGNPWATTTSDITVAANDRYFVDTSGGAKTITLPAAPQTGDQVSFIDVAGTFDTNALTINPNGLKIMGSTANLSVATENAGIQLAYSGSTNGWRLVQNF